MTNASQLIRMGLEIKHAVESCINVVHPIDSQVEGYPRHDFHRSVEIGMLTSGAPRFLTGKSCGRSPGVTGTAALLAVLDAMGLLVEDHAFTHEGVLGTVLKGRVLDRHQRDEVPMVVPAVEGSASITGFHEFLSD